ncbi:MAG: GtrA family protein [Verrucomicrobiota bacterium JB023]|nr:GtrA family protein [Verrucomicrobiota bacterium JB023]
MEHDAVSIVNSPQCLPQQTPASGLRDFILQFTKYALCGGAAFTTHQAVVYGLGYTINPAFGAGLTDQIRFERMAINNTVAFVISNTVAYFLNLRFVFKAGRHSKRTEVGLFFLASALGFFPALWSLDHVIRALSLNSHIATIVFAIVAAGGNFLARKFLIFSK